MRVGVSYEINTNDRQAVGWHLDGGSQAFTCYGGPGADTQAFRTAEQGRKAGRDQLKDFLWEQGVVGLDEVVGEYNAWLELPVREQLGDTAPMRFEHEPEFGEPPAPEDFFVPEEFAAAE